VEKVTGEFVGVFDADHKPDPGSFVRAWRWLSNGYDMVQGHCVVRNGEASWVARMVAVEFEFIYAVSHPGRSRVHGFGIFGGTNGYWRTDLLAATRMHGDMLTEDIDSSMRVLEGGHRIASDPGLLSRELAPTTLVALWKQRMRWAQGWLQVTLRHLVQLLRSPVVTARQKFGLLQLLLFRELFPWVSLQVFPLIAFFAVKEGSVDGIDWFAAEFVLATVFLLSVGPGQTFFAYKLAAPEVRVHRRWFVTYLFTSSFFFTEFKQGIQRLAQLKEWMGEHSWTVTPR
jgi:cellulose synthase/poly-beta-1,6-N-acetylglucosamine synthase-like glycosyltransferase